ncbi:osteopetrosis-associated transmembrane protein 1-like [Saccostrea cucullata]|uniref:osteopetrosis-associated transmembrane protein 1-like n=1 Tax=Saccostrea cuccullata TaxID=36930 RepID=UPI002ED58507
MKQNRFKWIFIQLVTVIGLVYSQVCQPLTSELSTAYIFRHQPSLFTNEVESFKTIIPASNVTDKCCAYLNDFADNASNFIRCSVERARPLRFCEKCVDSFATVTSIYNDIEKNVGGCHVFLLDADRVQAILQIHTMIKALWDASDCNNCFTSGSIDVEQNGTVTYKYNTDTMDFMGKYDNFTECVDRYTNGTYPDFTSINYTVCHACLQMYQGLNDHYADMRKRYNGKICMDLVDMMNYTRLMWGDARDLNCTNHDRDDMPVLLTSIILLTIPFLFYGATCICGERKKLKIMTQKRLKNPISVEVSKTDNSHSNHVNSIS